MKAPRFSVMAGALAVLMMLSSIAHSASVVADNFWYKVAIGSIDVDTDTFWCTLHTSSMTPSKAWDFRDDLTNEVSGTGYSSGGHACAFTASVDTTNHRIDVNISSHNWTTSTITARYVCAYKRRGGASSADELVGCFDFGGDVATTAGTFTVNAMSPAIRISN